MAKLGLKAYKSLLAMSTVTKDWVVLTTHDNNGHLLAMYRPCQIANITLGGTDDEDKIALDI